MNFFSYEYDPNVMFDMYTPMHVIMLGMFAVYVILYIIFRKKIFSSPHEKKVRYIFASVLAINQILLAFIETNAGHIYLPLHLCSISFILTIVLLITNNEKLFRFLFFAGIIGGVVSFAIPDLYHAGYNRFRFYEFIIAHGAIILVPVYYLTCYKFKVTKRDTVMAILITNVLGFSMLPVNLLLRKTGLVEDANYMFSLGPPEDVESVFGSFPIHYLSFELVLLVTFFGVYYLAKIYQDKTKAA